MAQAKSKTRRKPRKVRTRSGERTTSNRYWSGRVTRESNALDLDEGVFTWSDPKRIAASLKHSAQRSTRRKTDPYRSAMSMLIFYLNRGGKKLSQSRKHVLERAKTELRHQFGRA